jgi:hypothetical protein
MGPSTPITPDNLPYTFYEEVIKLQLSTLQMVSPLPMRTFRRGLDVLFMWFSIGSSHRVFSSLLYTWEDWRIRLFPEVERPSMYRWSFGSHHKRRVMRLLGEIRKDVYSIRSLYSGNGKKVLVKSVGLIENVLRS